MTLSSKFFDLKQSVRPGVLATYRTLLANQYLSPDELESINWDKRKRLLNHAYNTVPFYSRYYRGVGLEPQDIRSPEDWQKLPIITKDQIRNNYNDFISRNISKKYLRVVSTGGSTGKPLKLLQDTRFPIETLGWRMLSWWGVDPAEDAAFCWRLVRKSLSSRIMNDLIWWPTKRIWFDAAKMTDALAADFVAKFNKVKPAYFQGYTGSLDFVAQYILKNSLIVSPPKCVWGTSSPVSLTQRTNIEKAFRAPLYDQYGSSEIYWLAAQCRLKRGLHFFSDVRHLECVGADMAVLTPGEVGDFLVTDLENYGFPLLRYQNGDRGAILSERCTCGVNLPLIGPVKGRISDLLKTPSGIAVGGDYITTLFDDFPEAISGFQVRQAADYTISLAVIPGASLYLAEAATAIVVNALIKSTNGEVKVTSQFVKQIGSDRGKTRFVISDLL